MIAKSLKVSLVLCVGLISTSCNCTPEVKYVDKPVEVKVPVKCVVPDANCSFDRATDTEVVSSLLECIVEMKRNEEVCE